MSARHFKDFFTEIDYDLLYSDLDWEPQETNGPEDKGYCLDPWSMHKHGDTTGKLAINRDKGVYNCWVCGGGTVLNLVMAVKGLSYDEANDYLRGFAASDKATPQEFYEKVSRLLVVEETPEPTLPRFNEKVIERFQSYDPWFEQRGISEEVCKYFFLGSDGNCRIFKKDHGTYEGPAIILPHFWEGKLVGWQNRWLDDNRPSWVGKYTNTQGFPRETTVWGFDFCQGQSKPPVVVESVPTAAFLLTEGYPAIATFGSQITPSQLRILRRFQSGVILAADNDSAGRKWLQTAGDYLTRYIKVMKVPPVKGEGADLNDLPVEELSAHLKGATYYGIPQVPKG